jgi:hypothetical protein
LWVTHSVLQHVFLLPREDHLLSLQLRYHPLLILNLIRCLGKCLLLSATLSEKLGFKGGVLALVLSLHELFEGPHFFVETIHDAVFADIPVTIKVADFVFKFVLTTFMLSLELKLSLYIQFFLMLILVILMIIIVLLREHVMI